MPLPSAPIDQFEEATTIQPNDWAVIFQVATGKTLKTRSSNFGIDSPSSNYNWSSTYDYPVDDIVEYQGKLYKSLQTPNVGQVPTASGSTYWELVVKSTSSALASWAPGVFIDDVVFVMYDINQDASAPAWGLYALTNPPIRPFSSTDFPAELALGYWSQAVGDLNAVLTRGNNAGGKQIKNGADGTDPQDFVTKAQMDASAAGVVGGWKNPPVKARTTAALPTNTQGGAGTTLTATANGAFPNQDDIAFALNDDVLVANEVAAQNNGIYKITTLGDGGTPWVLTRRTDSNTAAELEGAAIVVDEGTVYADKAFLQTAAGITLGTTPIIWISLGSTPPDADTTTKGLIEILIQSEMNLGTDTTRAATAETIKKRDAAVTALVDASTIDIASDKNTLTSSATTRTFTISFVGDEMTIEVTLNTPNATYTMPAACLCVSEGGAFGDNLLYLTGSSGDKYIIAIQKIGSAYYVVAKNFGV